MNQKRWIAVAIAVILLIVSMFFGTGKKMPENGIFDSYFKNLFKNKMVENVLVSGDIGKRILVVPIQGVITSGSTYGYDHELIMDSLETALTDPTIKGVILKVNSPGGGVYESAMVKDKIMEIKQKDIPVYAVFEGMSASGGYYISAMADKIFASEETLTGSIGVIMSGYDMSELLSNLGIKTNVIKSAEHKDIMSSTRPMTEEEKGYMQEMINLSYNRFIDLVAEGRNLPREEVLKFADGRIFDGSQALKLKLIDDIAYYDDVVEKIQEDYGIERAQVFQHKRTMTPYRTIFSLKSSDTDIERAINAFINKAEEASVPTLMYIYGR